MPSDGHERPGDSRPVLRRGIRPRVQSAWAWPPHPPGLHRRQKRGAGDTEGVTSGLLPRQRAVVILNAPVGMAKLPMRSNPMVLEGINRASVRDTTKDLARQSRNKSSNPYLTTKE